MIETIGGICVVLALYAAVRVVYEKVTLRKLLYVNLMNFAVAGAIALILPHPITIIAAVAYFVGATLESNAIASAFARVGEDEA